VNIPMNAFLQELLAKGTSDTAGLDGVWIGLYIGINASPGPNLTMANLTEASYDGYARQQVGAWTEPYLSSDGQNAVIDGALHFRPSDSSFPQTMLGALYGSSSVSGGGNLIMIDPFPAPGVGLLGPNNVLSYVPEFELPAGGNYGGGDVLS